MGEPPLVQRVHEAATRSGVAGAAPEGPLLHVLAAGRGIARAAEIGTGAGVRAAWIVSALGPEVPFAGVEHDPRLAEAARTLFRDDPNVRILCGDWRAELPREAPFGLLVAAASGGWTRDDVRQVVELLAPGATLVVRAEGGTADRTPGHWLEHPALAAVEVTSPAAVIVAARRR